MSIKATGHHVLVHVGKPEEVSKGGIVLVETTRDAEKRGAEIGTVVDVGPTAWQADGLGGVAWAKVGDKIFFAKYAGKWVKETPESDEFLLIRDDDVIGRIEV